MNTCYLLYITAFLMYTSSHSQIRESDSIADTQEVNKKFNLTVMPFINYNRNLQFMFGVVPMVMYKLNQQDTISPKSISGVATVYSTNKSYFIGLFNKFYFNEDTWRGTLFVAFGDLNSQFFSDEQGESDFYNYATNSKIVSIGAQRKIFKNLFAGLTYTYANYNTVFEDDVVDESNTVTNGLDFNVLHDTRDDVYYPYSGNLIKAKWINYSKWFGNENLANKIKTVFNKYIPLRKNQDVLAARFSGTFGLGDIAFEQQSIVGGTDIRGYSEGKYRGDDIVALQGEYRLNFSKRMGLVGFAGVATLYGTENEAFDGEFLPGGGFGFRYRAFKDVKFNIGLDAALGKDDWGVYFRIGEAF